MKLMLSFRTYDLDREDWLMILKWYRILRIRIMHAPPNHVLDPCVFEDGRNCIRDGQAYGMTREEARQFLAQVVETVSWHTYLGSK